MLRLQKTRQRDISISLRDKERRLNRTFLCAFAIALGMHLFAILIFQIHAFIAQGDIVLPPTLVETDYIGLAEDSDNGVLAYIDYEGRQRTYTLAPKPSSPEIPEVDASFAARQMEYLKDQNVRVNPFASIEEDWSYLTKQTIKGELPFMQIHIAGVLADVPLVDDGIQHVQKQISGLKDAKGAYLTVYHVEVERRSGRIFWHDTLQKDELEVLKLINTLAENLLRQMQFLPDPRAFVSAGEIEIRFNFPEVAP